MLIKRRPLEITTFNKMKINHHIGIIDKKYNECFK